jgi:iron complex outermembrane recepter protein
VTEDPYTCSPALLAIATSLGAVCQPGNRQYDVVAGGNKLLTPEKSRSATLGLVFEPLVGVSASVDYWWVGIKDAFGQLEEATVFREPARFPGAWTTVTDVGTNTKYVAWNSGNLNLGKEYTSGIDIDVRATKKFDAATWVSNLTATYMVRQRYQQETGGKYYSDLGDNTEGGLLYRLKGNWRNSVKYGAWTHALNINYVSGYHDTSTEVEVLNSLGVVTGTEQVRLKIKPFITLDWQTQWAVGKQLDVTAGVLNVLDKQPPLTLSTTGGQQVGYDGNLYDPRGRTVYANLRYKF